MQSLRTFEPSLPPINYEMHFAFMRFSTQICTFIATSKTHESFANKAFHNSAPRETLVSLGALGVQSIERAYELCLLLLKHTSVSFFYPETAFLLVSSKNTDSGHSQKCAQSRLRYNVVTGLDNQRASEPCKLRI